MILTLVISPPKSHNAKEAASAEPLQSHVCDVGNLSKISHNSTFRQTKARPAQGQDCTLSPSITANQFCPGTSTACASPRTRQQSVASVLDAPSVVAPIRNAVECGEELIAVVLVVDKVAGLSGADVSPGSDNLGVCEHIQDIMIISNGLSRNQGVRTCLFSRTATNLLTYLCSRLEWFRFNESAHVMVKQKTLATDLSRGLGLVKSSFRSNPSVLGQIRAVSGQIRAAFFLELWLKSTYLHACFFATFCIDSPLSFPVK